MGVVSIEEKLTDTSMLDVINSWCGVTEDEWDEDVGKLIT